MKRISTLQPIHLYNQEPIICGSKKVPVQQYPNFVLIFVSVSYIYNCIDCKTFISQWKIARIFPIPKVKIPKPTSDQNL